MRWKLKKKPKQTLKYTVTVVRYGYASDGTQHQVEDHYDSTVYLLEPRPYKNGSLAIVRLHRDMYAEPIVQVYAPGTWLEASTKVVEVEDGTDGIGLRVRRGSGT